MGMVRIEGSVAKRGSNGDATLWGQTEAGRADKPGRGRVAFRQHAMSLIQHGR
jgi:hypothetical protein